MAKPANQPKFEAPAAAPAAAPTNYSGKAVFVERISNLLATVYEVEFASGVVIKISQITRAPDLPATSIGVASKFLWTQYRGA